MFEALWTAGDLAVYERRGFERMYDLTERVIPAEHRTTEPDDAETLRHFMRRTLRSRGVVTRQRLADYYRTPGGMKRLAEPVADLVGGRRCDRVPRRRVGRALRSRRGRAGRVAAGARRPRCCCARSTI